MTTQQPKIAYVLVLALAVGALAAACAGEGVSDAANQSLGSSPSPRLLNDRADPNLSGVNTDPSLSSAGISPGQSGQSTASCAVLDMGCACGLLLDRFSGCGFDELTSDIAKECQKLDITEKFIEECGKNRLSVNQCWTLVIDWLESCDGVSCTNVERCGQAPQKFIKPIENDNNNGNNGNGNPN